MSAVLRSGEERRWRFVTDGQVTRLVFGLMLPHERVEEDKPGPNMTYPKIGYALQFGYGWLNHLL